MKILRIVYDWPPPWDGLGPHPYELTAAQAKLGHEFTVFCGHWPTAGAREPVQNTTFKTFMREPLPGMLNLTTSALLLFSYLSYRRKNQTDLIHSHGHFAIWIYLYRKLLKKFFPNSKELDTPMVVHFHNTVVGRWNAAKEKKSRIKPWSQYIAWPLAKLSDQWAVDVADVCIFVSTPNAQDAIKYYGADPSRCFVVESGVNPSLFIQVSDEEKTKTRKELGLSIHDKVVLNHGRMVKRKNIDFLVEALKHLPDDYKLLLVGSGDNKYIMDIKTKIAEYHFEERVVLVGYTPYRQTAIAFQASDVFVLPSDFEGLPKVVMQSLSCGTPVLASGFELSDDIYGLNYLKDLSPENIASQIVEVVSQNQKVDVAKVTNNYSWRKRALQIESVYGKIKKD